MKKMKHVLYLAIFLILFVSCGKKEDGTSENKTLMYTMSTEPLTLDPYSVTDIYSRRMIKNIFDTLIEVDSNNNRIPGLAKSWKYLDPNTLELKLVENVKFHNGETLTSEDVKYSLETGKKSLKVGYYFDMIKDIETPDSNTVIIKTYKPSGTLLVTLSHAASSIVNKKDYESNKEKQFKPVGTGAYKLDSWDIGSKLTLSKNDDYFGKKPSIDTVEVKIIPEDNNRVIALQTGEVHIAYDISSTGLLSLKNEKNIKSYPTESLGVTYLGFNTENPKLKNEKIRKAISMGIDRNTAVKALTEGEGNVADSLLGPKVFGYASFEYPEYNPEKAKELLKEAGAENLKLKFVTSNTTLNKQYGEIFQAQLKEIGVDLEVITLDFGAVLKETNDKNSSEIFMLGWSNSSGDADNGFTTMLHSDSIGTNNRFFYSNKEFDNIINIARDEVDQNKRLEHYKKVQEMLAKDIPLLPVARTMFNSAVHKDIDGYVADPLAYLKFNTLKFKDKNKK